MYETEVNARNKPAETLPPEILKRFTEFSGKVRLRTTLPWSEHCTECVFPSCFKTCDLYEAREDGKCRRFVHGMVRLDHPEAAAPYLLEITFKRWGKVFAQGSTRMMGLEEAERREKIDRRLGGLVRNLILPHPIKKRISYKYAKTKNQMTGVSSHGLPQPDAFLLEAYNPAEEPVNMTFTIRSMDAAKPMPYQRLIDVPPGFTREWIPHHEMAANVDLTAPFKIEMTPNDFEKPVTLVFGMMEFVKIEGGIPAEVRPSGAAPVPEKVETRTPGEEKKVKCVVWDLDNTLWDGILVEDGLEKLQLKEGITDIIRELDARGILHSIVSKNDHDHAMKAVKHFGLDDYFLYPQISWGPKGVAVGRIAESLNIGADTLLLIDDSPFERDEVASVNPAVRTVDAVEYKDLLSWKVFQVPVTAESRARRNFYREQEVRKQTEASFDGAYFNFLQSCNIHLHLFPLAEDTFKRVHELTQRTNQMNFSGNRYTEERLREIITDDKIDNYVLECEDKFGKYGVIGFCLVDHSRSMITDLMFSCRVQSKRVEHAFVRHLIDRYTSSEEPRFFARYVKTERNAPSGKVFDDLGFETVEQEENRLLLKIDRDRAPADEGIIRITFDELLDPSRSGRVTGKLA